MAIMRNVIMSAILVCTLIGWGCSGNSAEELFKTAQFEELQRNEEHAVQLYKEIIEKYPDSEFAGKSKERLSELHQ